MDLKGNGISRISRKISNMLPKFIPLLLLVAFCCKEKNVAITHNSYQQKPLNANNPYPSIGKIPLPAGYERNECPAGSFGFWLRNVPLKKNKAVYTINGTLKRNQEAQYAVVDMSVGTQDLQQCADAVMRLRAEFLYDRKDFQKIAFIDNENHEYRYSPPYSRGRFETFLLKVFGMCGSASLSKQLKQQVALEDIAAGDVFIHGGFPGHAIIVMDVAVNKEGKKLYLLAQSYMPAQNIHVLINPANSAMSPWYTANDEAIIHTPEYTFSKYELKRW